MAAPSDYPQDYLVLKEMFSQLDPNMVRKVYEDHKDAPDPVNAATNELLTLAEVEERKQQKDKPEEPRRNEAGSSPSPEVIAQVGNVFPNLTQSVVCGALFQNQGQAQGAIELLMDIGEDNDAIAQIRDMNPEKKTAYATGRAKDREQHLAEREERLKREREEAEKKAEEQRRVREQEEKKVREAEEAAKRVHKEWAALVKAKQEAEKAQMVAENRAREVEAKLDEERRAGTMRSERIAELEQQKERDSKLALEAKQELERRLQAARERQLPGEPALDLAQSIVHLHTEAARKTTERERAKDELQKALDRLAEMESQTKLQQEQLNQLQYEKGALRKCTVSAEYSQREKRLLVSWRLGDDYAPTSSDWIGVFSIGSTNPKQYHTYISTESLQASTHECALPTEPGLYVCIFFYGKSHEMIGRSEQIYLGPSLEMVATANPAHRNITLRYKVKTGNPSNKDWIGFYRSDKPHKTYIEYKWLSPDTLEGVWEVKMPRRGGYNYEFRFFSHTVRTPLQVSNPITLPKEDELKFVEKDVLELGNEIRHQVSWNIVSVDPSNWDWIELVNTSDNNRVTWSYIDSTAAFITFTVPRTPGTYQYRYWARSIGSGPVAHSPTFEVANRDSLSLDIVDGILQATFDIKSIVLNNSCWIGLYPEGSDSRTQYHYISLPNNTVRFSATPGRYDVRFYSSSDKYKPIIRSAVVEFK